MPLTMRNTPLMRIRPTPTQSGHILLTRDRRADSRRSNSACADAPARGAAADCVPSICKRPVHPVVAYVEQPQNDLPANAPRCALRITIVDPHAGQAGTATSTFTSRAPHRQFDRILLDTTDSIANQAG